MIMPRISSILLLWACAGALHVLAGAAQTLPPLWRTSNGLVTAERRPDGLLITARRPNGSRLWTHLMPGSTSYSTRSLDGHLAVIVTRSGAISTNTTVVIGPMLTPPVEVPGVPTRVRPEDHLALFGPNFLGAPSDDEPIPFHVLHTDKSLKVDVVKFTVPGRTNCGAPTGVGEAGAESITNHYLYAVRTDQCGKFVTRFDWVNPASSPWIYPVRP